MVVRVVEAELRLVYEEIRVLGEDYQIVGFGGITGEGHSVTSASSPMSSIPMSRMKMLFV